MSQVISVIIPVYNSQDTIELALKSIFAQTQGRFEIIIINDGSSDATKAIIESFVLHNKAHKILVYNRENFGVSISRNFGLKKASGSLIAFLDSDDAWHPEKIAKQLEILSADASIDLLGTNRDGQEFKRFFSFKISELMKISPKLLLYKNFFMTSSLIFKKSIIDKVGYFNEHMNHSEDWEYCIRIAQHFNVHLYNKSMVHSISGKAMFGESGLSANLVKMQYGELSNLRLGYRLGVVSFFEYLFLNLYLFRIFIQAVSKVSITLSFRILARHAFIVT